jgi:predicted DNA-binding protein with PD1-like motif
MNYTDIPGGYVMRFYLGEEVISTLISFVKEKGIGAGWVQGLGALRAGEIGYYDLHTRTYERWRFDEDLEVAPLVGNVGTKDGEPFPHLHVTLGARDFSARAGHLFRGEAGATLEMRFDVLPGVRLDRQPDERVGLGLLALPHRFDEPPA